MVRSSLPVAVWRRIVCCSQSRIIRWNGHGRWRKGDEHNCYALITTSLLWTSIVSVIVLKPHFSASKDKNLKRGDYIKSLYDSGRRHKVTTGSQMGHSLIGNGSYKNRLVIYLTPQRSSLYWKKRQSLTNASPGTCLRASFYARAPLAAPFTLYSIRSLTLIDRAAPR